MYECTVSMQIVLVSCAKNIPKDLIHSTVAKQRTFIGTISLFKLTQLTVTFVAHPENKKPDSSHFHCIGEKGRKSQTYVSKPEQIKSEVTTKDEVMSLYHTK